MPVVYICISSQYFGDWIIYQLLLTSSFEGNSILYVYHGFANMVHLCQNYLDNSAAES